MSVEKASFCASLCSNSGLKGNERKRTSKNLNTQSYFVEFQSCVLQEIHVFTF